MKKNLFLFLLSVGCLIVGTWTIIDISKSSNKSKQLNLDLSKLEFTVDGKDLTKPYIDSLTTNYSIDVKFNISTIGDKDSINNLNALFISSHEMFAEIGSPNRYKTTVQNSSSYVFDKLGFYLKTNDQMKIISYSIYFQKGKLDIAPNQVYKGSLKIDETEILEGTSIETLKSKFSLQPYLVSNNYILNGNNKKIIFNFDSPNEKLVNILIEKR